MNTKLPMLKACASKAGCRAIDELPVAYMEVNRDGEVCYLNRAAREMHDPSLGELTGRHVWALMPPAERDAHRSAFEREMKTGEASPAVVLRSIYTKAGEYRMYEVHRRLILDDEGNPAGMRLVSFDVTEMETARKGAQDSVDWMNSVFQSMAEAMIVIDALGFVRYLNPAGEALTGWRREELAGMQIEDALPLVSSQSPDGNELSFGVTIEQRWAGKAVLLDRHGRKFSVELSTSPIVDREKGYTTGVVGVMRRADNGLVNASAGLEPDCDCGIVIIE